MSDKLNLANAILDKKNQTVLMDDIMAEVNNYLTEVRNIMDAPSMKYRPNLFIDGDMWCALYGKTLQDGVAGFGSSPEKAMDSFNDAWVKDTADDVNINLNNK